MAQVIKPVGKVAAAQQAQAKACAITTDDADLVLGALDTFHDFCKSARISTSKRAEGSEPDRLLKMRTYLPKLIGKLYSGKNLGTTLEDNIKKLSCETIKGVSTIEHDAVDMFEEKEPFRSKLQSVSKLTETITFQEILDAYKGTNNVKNPIWDKYLEGLEIKSIEIRKGDFDFDFEEDADEESNTGSERTAASKGSPKPKKSASSKKSLNPATVNQDFEILSWFILRFFFFTETLDNYYITFDAGKRMLGDIFRKNPKVSNVIFPQTIADSAPTSFSSLGAKNTYIFPSAASSILFKSAFFSQAFYKTTIENKGYDDSNPYGFSLKIQSLVKPALFIEIPFSPTQTEGPSVNYLVDILTTAQENYNKSGAERTLYEDLKKKGTIITIGKYFDANKAFTTEFENLVKEEQNGLLPDLKRGGDYEAVYAAAYTANLDIKGEKKYQYFMFSTIDLLCALRARLENLNTIWQGTDRMILYRNLSVLPTNIKKNQNVEKVREISSLLTKLEIFTTQDLPAQIELAKKTFQKGKGCVVPYADHIKDLQYKKRVEELLNALLRFRMEDLLQHSKTIPSFETTELPKLVPFKVFQEIAQKENKDIADLLNKDDPTKITYNDTVYDLNDETTKINTLYDIITGKVKEKLKLDLEQKLKVDDEGNEQALLLFEIDAPILGERTNSQGKNDDIFTMKDNPVFEFYPGAFTQLYDVLLYINDLAYKNSKKSSRDYPKIMKRILTEDPAAPVQYFKAAEDVINQFQTEDIKTQIANILDFREAFQAETDVGEKRDAKGIEYLVGSSYKQLDESDAEFITKDYENTGVVNRIRNLFMMNSSWTEEEEKEKATQKSQKKPAAAVAVTGTLPFNRPNETLNYEEPAKKPSGRQGGGGLTPSALQYYDLSDLLYVISSKAAAYIESAYAQEYPFYALYCNVQEYIKRKESLGVTEKFEYLKSFVALLNTKQTEIEKGRTQTNLKSEIGDLRDRFNALSKENLNGEIIDSLIVRSTRQYSFQQLCENYLPKFGDKIGYPSMKIFFQKVDTYTIQDDIEEISNSSQLLYDELAAVWQAGLYDLRQNKDYLYVNHKAPTGLNTENLLTFLLTLIKEGTVYKSSLGDTWTIEDARDRTNNIVIKETQIGHEKTKIQDIFGSTSIATKMLYFFTLLENIMNPHKFSYFLVGKYEHKLYDAQEQWNIRLYSFITSLLPKMKDDAARTIRVELPIHSQGGGRRYPKKTRKQRHAKHSRKSRKYNKTRRSSSRK